MGLRFATMIPKAGKLDMCEVIGLMVAALNFVSGLRYVEDHRLPCSFGRKRCVRTFGFGQDLLGMMASSRWQPVLAQLRIKLDIVPFCCHASHIKVVKFRWRRLLCYMIDILFFSLSVLFS
jgi:hypothetical protein